MVIVSPHGSRREPLNTGEFGPELVAYAKANPNKFNFASADNGPAVHLAGEQFQRITGTRLAHVPHKGSAVALVGIVGDEVDLTSRCRSGKWLGERRRNLPPSFVMTRRSGLELSRKPASKFS